MTATADAAAPAAAALASGDTQLAVPAKAMGGAAAAPPPPAVDAKERESMRAFWAEHSSKPSVESMMLDSQAAEIDSEERPEVRGRGHWRRRAAKIARLPGRRGCGEGPGPRASDPHTPSRLAVGCVRLGLGRARV